MTRLRSDITGADARLRPVQLWLYAICALIFAMILLGGATRLTDSGLSIAEWQPVLGAIPPLGDADWQKAFDLYKQIPEFRLVNSGMTLEEFKTIYWWEWAHRFLGRFIGIAFLLPFLWFLRRGAVPAPLLLKLIIMFLLGGAQGALGWYMVTSGLVDRVDVSQYRLAAHLGLAVAILGYIFWVAGGLSVSKAKVTSSRGEKFSAAGLVALVFFQIISGAFVAGLDAGMGYNTWPLMDGAFIPDGLGAMQPWHVNLFENALTVQFNHRLIAYLLVGWVVFHAALVSRAPMASAMVAIALLQAGLGVWTLLAQVPIELGLAHQAGAMLLWLAALQHMRRLAPAT